MKYLLLITTLFSLSVFAGNGDVKKNACTVSGGSWNNVTKECTYYKTAQTLNSPSSKITCVDGKIHYHGIPTQYQRYCTSGQLYYCHGNTLIRSTNTDYCDDNKTNISEQLIRASEDPQYKQLVKLGLENSKGADCVTLNNKLYCNTVQVDSNNLWQEVISYIRVPSTPELCQMYGGFYEPATETCLVIL